MRWDKTMNACELAKNVVEAARLLSRHRGAGKGCGPRALADWARVHTAIECYDKQVEHDESIAKERKDDLT